MTTKTIFITGAGSGFGEAAAIGMAQAGHNIIATAQISPQVAALRSKVADLGLDNLRVEKLDLHDPYDVALVQTFEIDVLWNNAGIGESGPVSEIPIELVRRNYETNVFKPLELVQERTSDAFGRNRRTGRECARCHVGSVCVALVRRRN
jgi:NAD(P)-dependent dehydrogenase (short-subunit alcohol dehydrogenase family)